MRLLYLFTFIFIISCTPEEVFIKTFPGDQEFGSSTGIKNNNDWSASNMLDIFSVDTNYLVMNITTYSEEGFLREALDFAYINTDVGEYKVDNDFNGSNIYSVYTTYQSDGDVLEDFYEVDTQYNSVFKIISYSEMEQVLSGCIETKFKIRDYEARTNDLSPEFVTFKIDFQVKLNN